VSADNVHSIQIKLAQSIEEVAQARELFLEYANSLGFSLCFQGFDKELADLPGAYAPPSGRLLLAIKEGSAIGCVGLRDLGDGYCEMKRLYVRPDFRSESLGRRLAEAIITEAKAIGYSAMRLDTLETMEAARKLYRSLGFKKIAPYYENPIPSAEYLELVLM
jgi:putative acetyltransferase